MCEGLSKISSNSTLHLAHLIKVGELKRFKKVSSDLKTTLETDFSELAVSRALRKAKHVSQC